MSGGGGAGGYAAAATNGDTTTDRTVRMGSGGDGGRGGGSGSRDNSSLNFPGGTGGGGGAGGRGGGSVELMAVESLVVTGAVRASGTLDAGDGSDGRQIVGSCDDSPSLTHRYGNPRSRQGTGRGAAQVARRDRTICGEVVPEDGGHHVAAHGDQPRASPRAPRHGGRGPRRNRRCPR